MKKVDFLIVGRGLAGSLLALRLLERGRSVLVVDDANPSSASRTAAGLFNPVTGQRLVLQPGAEKLVPAALGRYRQLEGEFGRPLFHPLPLWRLIASEKEREAVARRRADAAYADYLAATPPAEATALDLRAPRGILLQQQTGYLDTDALLDAAAAVLDRLNARVLTTLAYTDMRPASGGMRWNDVEAEQVVFCEGFRGRDNPWFGYLPLQPAKGEILTVRCEMPLPPAIVKGEKWLMPRMDGHYRLGATYQWEPLDEVPTEAARRTLLTGFAALFAQPPTATVVEQRVGVRPASRDRLPLLGRHPAQPRLAIANGFGSKGSLLMPWYLERLVDHLLDAAPLPPEADIRRFEQ